MKKYVLALAIALAIPSVAFAADGDKKPCCCCEKKDVAKGCCDDAKPADHSEHADHQMDMPKQ
ncbi:hypothetical protein ACFO0A_00640 [Novosphingobium tardum]|uniref:Uncharacterized protein n=1 Tax=Novosphingobium tardum TaxID=1538021 RepID=A0ABV8RKE3_9SPHN